jgi:hypothetical protein
MMKEFDFSVQVQSMMALDADLDLADVQGLDEIIDTGTIRVQFSYPLSKPVVVEFTKERWTMRSVTSTARYTKKKLKPRPTRSAGLQRPGNTVSGAMALAIWPSVVFPKIKLGFIS